MKIGPYTLKNNLVLAPMAGVTDRLFRQLCRQQGAAMAVSEMVTANAQLWGSRKTQWRLNHEGESLPRSVQIAGADPAMLAQAAQMNAELGAQIIDINMGCPAKKVCNVMAGSALLQNEDQVERILTAVVDAVDIPVTLKIRTGWDPEHRNALQIATIAENAGIQALAIHGRTRACRFAGEAEYATIAAVKTRVKIPVIANGDIDSPQKAASVLQQTGADGLMIGRAAQGNPWIFREVLHYLRTGEMLPPPSSREIESTLLQHLDALYSFYGEYTGVRVARKHLAWYSKGQVDGAEFRRRVNVLENAEAQQRAVRRFFRQLHSKNKEMAA